MLDFYDLLIWASVIRLLLLTDDSTGCLNAIKSALVFNIDLNDPAIETSQTKGFCTVPSVLQFHY